MNMCGLKTSGGFGCILAHCVGLELALVQYYKDGVLLIGYEVFCLMMLKLGATEKGTNRGLYAALCGGLARYINHSCNPNCATEIVEVDRELRLIIFAKRKTNRGEEEYLQTKNLMI
uniref:SET domain-containing protein n=1 Tax=Glossina palpalis gambiensis TaxID=67801 RepID=A0A1B0BR47_9MUSC